MLLKKLRFNLNPTREILRSAFPQRTFAASTDTGIKTESEEIEHHSKYAKGWWDPCGDMYPLHSLNKLRVPFIREGLISTKKVRPELVRTPRVLDGIEILEVGCGGGILTESLARLHANMTGIDLSNELLKVAKEHLKEQSPELCDRIQYKLEPIEVHMKENSGKYDAVVLSEVLEHVDYKAQMLTACVETLKPGGSIFITTPNKTCLAWLGGVVLAENVFRIVPKGTHQYEKFISPIDVERILITLNCSTILVNGLTYIPMTNDWMWINSTTFSYALQAVKN